MKRKYNNWNQINWNQINKEVSSLQENLVVAYENGNYDQVHSIQNKLMMSFAGRATAVRRVISNRGKNTAGIDKITWNTPTEKYNAIVELRKTLTQKEGAYKASLVKRVWIEKTNSEELRPLGIPTMHDRSLQALVLLCLDPIVESQSDHHSYGSRLFRSAHDAIQRIRTLLDKVIRPLWIWDADIAKCFDEISHSFLEKQLKILLSKKGNEYVSKWLKAGVMDKGSINYPTKGTPQGSIISPILCNIALNGLENIVRPGLPRNSDRTSRKYIGVWLIRYVDDFILTSPTREGLESKKKLIECYKKEDYEFLKPNRKLLT